MAPHTVVGTSSPADCAHRRVLSMSESSSSGGPPAARRKADRIPRRARRTTRRVQPRQERSRVTSSGSLAPSSISTRIPVSLVTCSGTGTPGFVRSQKVGSSAVCDNTEQGLGMDLLVGLEDYEAKNLAQNWKGCRSWKRPRLSITVTIRQRALPPFFSPRNPRPTICM